MHALGLLPNSVHGGAFPGWLAPVQLVILPVSGAEEDAARALAGRCAEAGLRAEVRHAADGSLAARVRASRAVPYQAVDGPREAAGDMVALRLRDGRRPEAQPSEQMLRRIAGLVRERSADLWVAGYAARGYDRA